MFQARDSWRVNIAHVSSFVLISILRGQPRTPPTCSGDNLGVLDYHLKHTFTGSPFEAFLDYDANYDNVQRFQTFYKWKWRYIDSKYYHYYH